MVTANLARTWRRAGHDVLLLCQERKAELLDFVDSAGDFAADNLSFSSEPTGVAPAAGRARLIRPNIGEVLPVYVYDEYAGFKAKRFVDLDQSELRRYVETNVHALRTAIATHRPDAIFINHEVMGPYIAKVATSSTQHYVVMLHGSALEWAVREDSRYVPFAEEGLGSAHAVVGGSNYMVERAASVVSGWQDRAVVVNPGTDVDLFNPVERKVDAPVVGFVGKLITPKGPQNLLAAIGLTSTPDLRAVFVGYGGYEDEMREIARTMQSGDLARTRALAERGDGGRLDHVVELLDRLDADPAGRDAFMRRIEQRAHRIHRAARAWAPVHHIAVMGRDGRSVRDQRGFRHGRRRSRRMWCVADRACSFRDRRGGGGRRTRDRPAGIPHLRSAPAGGWHRRGDR